MFLLLTLNKEMFTGLEDDIYARIATLDNIITLNFRSTHHY